MVMEVMVAVVVLRAGQFPFVVQKAFSSNVW